MKDILINEARLKLINATSVSKITDPKEKAPKKKAKTDTDFLDKAMESAENCISLLPQIEESTLLAIKSIEENKEKDKFWETRVKFLLDNLEVMKATYPIYAEEAKRRRLLYMEVSRKNSWAEEREKCTNDTLYWFDNYAWTADPRKTGLWSLPFMLYDFQRETVGWLESLIFVRQENGLIEKSRDLGLSWLISALLYKHWQHPKDGAFQALVGSITASECDTIGDPSSLFEKLRIQSRLQPEALLPKGWDGIMPYMKAINPENGSSITGENASGDFGRSGRYKCLVDNTLIHTPKGLRTIKEMVDSVDTEILSPNGEVKRIKNYIIRPPEKTYKVKLRGGFEITGTSDHPLMVVTDKGLSEKSISELKFRDKLRLVPLSTVGSQTMSLDLARVLGYLVSEGYVARIDGKFDFVNADDEILEDYKKSWYQVYKAPLRDVKGTSTSSITGKVSNWKTITINNVGIRRELASLGLDYVKSAHKTIPIAVRMGTLDIKKAFLQSLFEGDGGIYWDTAGNPRVSYTSKSLELLKQIQVMLLEFGIIATKNKSNTREEHKLNLISYQAYLFGQKIGFRGTRKSSLLPKLVNPKWKIKPFDIEVLEVVEDKVSPTYDLECEDHLFIANGLISHNCILFDEFSAFEADTQALTASSQSSPCRIFNSTARGTGNEFYRLRGSGSIPVLSLHWKQHPYKSESWYEYQKLTMNPVMVAQELDIDYNASQPNKVYPDYNESYHVVTQSEVMRALPSFRDHKGRFKIPFGHKIMMGEDVGQTDSHAHVLLWFVTLKEGTTTVDGIDLSGCVLCYREIVFPSHTTPRKGAIAIKEAESLNYESELVYDRLISQEALTERDIYEEEYGLSFRHWKPDYNSGIARVRDYLEIINFHQPHPFRESTRADKFPKGKPIMGRPSLFLVSEDEQGELQYNQTLQSYTAHIPDNSKGLMRLRHELPAYHYPVSELGKELKKMRPKKIFDDACFVAGTKITIKDGYKNIEDIKIGDLVLTRWGYKKVIDSQPTGVKQTYTLHTNKGSVTATPNHKIWADGKFTRLDAIRCGSILFGEEECKQLLTTEQLSLTESHTEDTQIQKAVHQETTTTAECTTTNLDTHHSTGIFGNIIMERFPTSTTYTIKTIILRIMTFLIYNVLHIKNTLSFTLEQKYQTLKELSYRICENLQKNGTSLRLAENGTVNRLRSITLKEYQLNTSALDAQNNLNQETPKDTLSFAHSPVNANIDTKTKLGGLTQSVKDALRYFSPKRETKGNTVPNIVVDSVTINDTAELVYNITVEEAHEYFANSFLSLNCDVLRCVATECFAPISPLSYDDKFEKSLPDNLKRDNIENVPLNERGMLFMQRVTEKRHYDSQNAITQMSYRDKIWHKANGNRTT